ncbi:MAG: amidohydrolase [Flavobacteriales bacterium]|nr:amidohydrolase [Flavobacteriales bacterium]MBK9287331.1 amidohydrolase [Flavobacteriales bacterium]MBL0036146.1 amidohydrolase [Flavobacteriales bacterium]
MRDLRVALVQSMLHWEDAAANRAMFTQKFASLKGTTDLVVLPEMFSTGFSMRSAELAEPMDGPTVTWMKEQAWELDAAIYGSAIITEDGKCYNRGLFVKPDGTVIPYDKRHLFRMAEEIRHYTPGAQRVVVEWRGWRLLLQICYDLRFPVFARNRGDYDALLYVANWPEPRRYPWSQLLIARAIENQSYVIGVNRVGMDGKGHHYTGDSASIDPRGDAETMKASKEDVLHTVLHREALDDFRAKFPVADDADDFSLML